MNPTIELSASQMTMFMTCREKWRLAKIERLVPVKPAIHLVFGQAVHYAIESFWKGDSYENSYAGAAHILEMTDQSLLTPPEIKRFDEMWDSLPDIMAVYFETHEQQVDEQEMVEGEWVYIGYMEGVSLKGRIDRFTKGWDLYEVKTASEIGKTWKRDYKEAALRDFALGLYDWYLCRSGMVPRSIQMEVLLKPWKDKVARLEVISLNEIIYYRERFKVQLDWVVKEMVHHILNYGTVKPWPMSTTACVGRYGPCDYLPVCNWGETDKIMKLYSINNEAA